MMYKEIKLCSQDQLIIVSHMTSESSYFKPGILFGIIFFGILQLEQTPLGISTNLGYSQNI